MLTLKLKIPEGKFSWDFKVLFEFLNFKFYLKFYFKISSHRAFKPTIKFAAKLSNSMRYAAICAYFHCEISARSLNRQISNPEFLVKFI